MIMSGPTNVTLAPPPPAPTTAAQCTVFNATLDMVAHTYTINYGGTLSGQLRTVTGTIPAPQLTSLVAMAKAAIEADQGWTAGTGVVVST